MFDANRVCLTPRAVAALAAVYFSIAKAAPEAEAIAGERSSVLIAAMHFGEIAAAIDLIYPPLTDGPCGNLPLDKALALAQEVIAVLLQREVPKLEQEIVPLLTAIGVQLQAYSAEKLKAA